MPQFEREITEEEVKKMSEIWGNWLKNKPVQKEKPSDTFEMFDPKNKKEE